MNAAIKPLLLLITLWLFVTGSCKKPAAHAGTDAGKGGNTAITVTPEHHGYFVDTCTIYIKYNSLDEPSNGVYDDSAVCILADTVPIAVFPGLKNGDYYIFGMGYHALYVPPYVKGGLPCTINNQDTIKVYLPTYSY